jgi:hypothetical protein
MFCALRIVFGRIEYVGSRFNVLCSRTSFLRYRRRLLPFSCFASPDTFSTVLRASGNVFLFCTPGLIFGDTGGVGSRFHILPARTHFRLYRGRRVPFSCFARPKSFFAVTTASFLVFMFCAPRHVFGGAEDVGSPFHVLRARTRFRRNRGRRVPIS